jgi:RecB family exonuclease
VWPEARAPGSFARAAALVRDLGVFSGRDPILRGLDRAANDAGDAPSRAGAASASLLVHRLFTELATVSTAATWSQHVARARRLAASLGLAADGDGDEAIERLFNALDDQAGVYAQAGGDRPLPAARFVAAVEAVAGDPGETVDEPLPGAVALATVERAAGARARYVVLANLAEGTFPTRAAVLDDGRAGPHAFARELARFLRVLGSAREGLTLAYPTRDEKGQEVLPAGFLDDLRRQFEPHAIEAVSEVTNRLDPALIDHDDLAVSPADARARAVALACSRNEREALVRLASDPAHRPVLDGAAAALRLTSERLGRRSFSAYDGRLDDPAAAAAVAAQFAPSYVFSASMLESYLTCPFQFFMKYVLKLTPVDDRDELDEDYANRGSRLHRLLEELERGVLQGTGDRLAVSEIVIRTEMRVELTVSSEADPGLNVIEKRRVEQVLRRYARQAHDYATKPKGPTARPAHFELAFGPDDDTPYPCLVLGEGATAVRLQGKIDRVDRIESPEGPRFRVIDYKTGVCPSGDSVRKLVMVQLPLYAMAVERLAMVEEGAAVHDLGYWSLRENGGYQPVKLGDWAGESARLEAKLLETAARLRSGLFVVQPSKPDCERTCDYAMACRIRQVRRVGKRLGPAGV